MSIVRVFLFRLRVYEGGVGCIVLGFRKFGRVVLRMIGVFRGVGKVEVDLIWFLK